MTTWRPKPGRVPCAVPHCRRTTGERHYEWICGKHWRAVDRATKRNYRKICRAWSSVDWDNLKTHADVERTRNLHRAGVRFWERMKREAIEAALGIG